MDMKILDEIRGTRFQHAVILTYTLQLDWLERTLLPHFSASLNRIVIADQSRLLEEMENAAKLGRVRGANRNYLTAAVNVPGSFHPKVILLVGKDQGLALIGSGNATQPGMSGPGEQYALYRYPQNPSAFGALGEVLTELCLRVDATTETRLRLLLQENDWLSGPSADSPIRHNLTTSMLDHLTSKLAGRRVNEVVVHAPFFDQHLVALRELLVALKPELCTVLVQPLFTSIDPEALANLSQELNVNVQEISRHKTRLHAKFYLVRLGERELVLAGSPNCTKSALLATAHAGNLEVASLVEGPKGSFDHIIAGVDRSSPSGAIADIPVSYRPMHTPAGIWRLTLVEIEARLIDVSVAGAARVVTSALVGGHAVDLVGEWPKYRGELSEAAQLELIEPITVRVVTLNGEVSNPVYPRVRDDLERAWGAPDPEVLGKLGVWDVSDEDFFASLAALNANLLFDDFPVLRSARGAAGKPPDNGDDELGPTIREQLEVDIATLQKDPRFRQYLEHGSGGSGQDRTGLGILRFAGRQLYLETGVMRETAEEAVSEGEREKREAHNRQKQFSARALGKSWARQLARICVDQCLGAELPVQVVARNHAVIQLCLYRLASRKGADYQSVLDRLMDCWEAFWGVPGSAGWYDRQDPDTQFSALENYEVQDGPTYLIACLLLAATQAVDSSTQDRLTQFARRALLYGPVAITNHRAGDANQALAAAQGLETEGLQDVLDQLAKVVERASPELLLTEIAERSEVDVQWLEFNNEHISGRWIKTLKCAPDLDLDKGKAILLAWMVGQRQPCYRLESPTWLLVYECEPVLQRLEGDPSIYRYAWNKLDRLEERLPDLEVPTSIGDRIMHLRSSGDENRSLVLQEI
jgi:hypothetical protein